MNHELSYTGGEYSASDLQELIVKQISEIQTDPDLQQQVRRYGVEPSQLSPDSFEVHQVGAGLDPALVSLIVAFVAPPLNDVWRNVLLPRLRRKYGENVIGEDKETDDSETDD